jgi:hypothetical protein
VVLQIEPETYTAVYTTPASTMVTSAYLYKTGPVGQTSYLTYGQALAQTGRTVTMTPLDALAYQNANASISVLRNKILFPIEDLGKVETTSYFLFQTPNVQFLASIVPLLEHASFPLNSVSGANLNAQLDSFYKSLFTGGDGTIAVAASMAGAYSYTILDGASRISLPINLQPPAQTPVDPNVVPAFVQPFAAMIDAWRAERKPTLAGSPQVNIKLQVYSASTAKQPLVIVEDVFHDV